MYRVSPFVRRFGLALLSGAAVATLWVNLDHSGYYDAIEYRLADLPLPGWLAPGGFSLTPMSLVSDGLMALFTAFVAKELWEALVLERGALSGRAARLPLAAVLGGTFGAIALWLLTGALIETAEEASFGIGWQVPVGSDVVIGYLVGRRVFGAGHPALHLLLLTAIGFDILGLVLLGLTDPSGSLWRLVWLVLPLVACGGVWLAYGRAPAPARPSLPVSAACSFGPMCWRGWQAGWGLRPLACRRPWGCCRSSRPFRTPTAPLAFSPRRRSSCTTR